MTFSTKQNHELLRASDIITRHSICGDRLKNEHDRTLVEARYDSSRVIKVLKHGQPYLC